jgi:NhaA family Na+:H+ antiporter
MTVALWLTLHAAGVDAALAGVLLAAFLPTRPAPAAAPLLAQAATALAALEHAQSEARAKGDDATPIQQQPIWEWASRNLSAAAARLLSPADRVERAADPWASYVVLPLFAFSATGAALSVNLGSPGASRVLLGVVLGLALGKPLGVTLAAIATVKSGISVMPEDTSRRAFLGAAILCGVSDPVALLMADQAFPHSDYATVAKIGVLLGSALAAVLGALVLVLSPAPVTPADKQTAAA